MTSIVTSTARRDLPLDGITVVSFEQAVAAPIATRHLADLGARVIKIERVGEGDFARNYDTAVHGLASHFVWLNRGKESVCVDMKSAEGLEVTRRLLDRADVVVQNFAPGAMERLGLGADALRRDRPELIVVNMTGYGTAGPLQARKAYDMLVQAETGLCSITGTPETATKTGIPAADIAAGMYALTAVQAALFRRERTGVGAAVDVSMFDATVEWLGHPMYLQMYQDTQVERMGLSHASIAPYDAYPTVDGQILIGVQNDRGWRALVTEVFGRSDLAEHPKFATNILRVEHRPETDQVVAEHTRRFDTEELDKRLAAAGVPAARLNGMRDLIDHPQLSERARWREVDTAAGPVRAVLPPMTFTDVELPMGPVPALGEHTDAVLTELGLTDTAIAGLRTGGAVG
ncbi:L-carnitine dehydratase/bile acid-inducible protein F [Rhodococcus wratislaviensis]|uniref:L-carnitine dehydratase/bile acid-inducible protein F n=1 Tax=Rhodococcus wratislaviensis TaxID=44752 RepID=A0A402C772_RHOWR|nr:CaiB/BaiF CoA-transferase family protein [Rhodococcus wratislaviensis]GCE39470.1 L-carnitine dehydratase/bile acid-inducible protein F [Rhodococcus wratislaviensis]